MLTTADKGELIILIDRKTGRLLSADVLYGQPLISSEPWSSAT